MISSGSTMEAAGSKERAAFDAHRIRQDFPILRREVHGKPLVYLDSANTSQKPQAVIDAVARYYRERNANIHRATHLLSEEATQAYEGAREKIRGFVHAGYEKEIIFVRGTTEAINLVATSWGRRFLREGDEVVISWMEHHSNIVPWQIACEAAGAALRVIPIDDRGELDVDAYEHMLNDRTRLVSLVHISNSLGTVNPVRDLVAAAKARGITTLVDGAQAVPHTTVDVQEIGCDFYAFSSHKMVGPMGIGALYGRREILEEMPPFQGGGDMIRSVSFERTTYNTLPWKFEAGTPNVADAVGFGEAVDYLSAIGMRAIAAHEADLLAYATERLSEIDGLTILGTARRKAGVISFILAGIHPHDIGTMLDREGIAVRTGQHCCQPVMDRFGIPATTRASLALYNTREDIDALAAGIRKVQTILG